MKVPLSWNSPLALLCSHNSGEGIATTPTVAGAGPIAVAIVGGIGCVCVYMLVDYITYVNHDAS